MAALLDGTQAPEIIQQRPYPGTVGEALIENWTGTRFPDARDASAAFLSRTDFSGTVSTVNKVASGLSGSSGSDLVGAYGEYSERNTIAKSVKYLLGEENNKHDVLFAIEKLKNAGKVSTFLSGLGFPMLGLVVGSFMSATPIGLGVGLVLGGLSAFYTYADRVGRAKHIETIVKNRDNKAIESSDSFIQSRTLRGFPKFAANFAKFSSYAFSGLIVAAGVAGLILAPQISIPGSMIAGTLGGITIDTATSSMVAAFSGIFALAGLSGIVMTHFVERPEAQFYTATTDTINQFYREKYNRVVLNQFSTE